MATSGSAENAWQGTALVHSGRPDPVWTVHAHDATALERRWSALAPHVGPVPPPPGLGYRGCRIRGPGRDWLAYGGVVTLHGAGAPQAKADPERAFERAAIATAPAGLVPPAALPEAVRR
jgi:hypothetical protein